jgi:hypothetical protein
MGSLVQNNNQPAVANPHTTPNAVDHSRNLAI